MSIVVWTSRTSGSSGLDGTSGVNGSSGSGWISGRDSLNKYSVVTLSENLEVSGQYGYELSLYKHDIIYDPFKYWKDNHFVIDKGVWEINGTILSKNSKGNTLFHIGYKNLDKIKVINTVVSNVEGYHSINNSTILKVEESTIICYMVEFYNMLTNNILTKCKSSICGTENKTTIFSIKKNR